MTDVLHPAINVLLAVSIIQFPFEWYFVFPASTVIEANLLHPENAPPLIDDVLSSSLNYTLSLLKLTPEIKLLYFSENLDIFIYFIRLLFYKWHKYDIFILFRTVTPVFWPSFP